MIKSLRKLLFALCVLLTCTGFGQFKVVGYQPYWAGSASSIQYSKLTHINYAFALPQSNGHLKALNNPGFLQQIVANGHSVGTKVYIAIGGWSDNGTVLGPTFETLASTSTGRTNLVNDAMALVHTYNLDGVDIDWEFPNPGASANNFAALMQQLATSLHAEGKGLSAAVNATSYYGNNILSSTFSYIDHFNIMAYDNTSEPNHSSYAFAQSSLNYWVSQRGLAKSKAILGVPFYARPSWNAFSTLVAQGANPYSDQFGSDYYNGITTIQNKTQLAFNSGGGIMIWELSQDASGSNSLLSAIDTKKKSFGGTTNKNPSVSITSPSNGASFTAPASITINASASDPDGSISKVQFYNGSTLLGTDNTSPYSFSWSNVAAGSYSITAKAYDNSTGTATSSVVSVTVKTSTTTTNKAPTVSITSPSGGASFNAPASITVSANASDADGSISKVEFYHGGTLIGTEYTSPYSLAWKNVAAGSYSLTAKAYDNKGAVTTSGSVSITVKTVTSGGCSGVPQYVEGSQYVAGSKVQNVGKQYQCKPYPYTGWCSGAAWAYAPGTGTYWQDAWTLVGTCTAKMSATSASSVNEGISPNPAHNLTTVEMKLNSLYSSEETLTIISSTGSIMSTEIIALSEGENSIAINIDQLHEGIYLVKVGEKTFRFVKQ
jgi:hypothetical protein